MRALRYIGGFLLIKWWGDHHCDFRKTGQWTKLYTGGIKGIWRPSSGAGENKTV